jgi:diguanylate cyclase (GGDEF)-like protein
MLARLIEWKNRLSVGHASDAARHAFAHEHRRLQKENVILRQILQQEREYAQNLIRLANCTQHLLTITDRKVLLKNVTTALCEDLNFSSAVLWVVDDARATMLPISWANVSLSELQGLEIDMKRRPYVDLLTHRKSYFIVDDLREGMPIDNPSLNHIHDLSRILDSEAVYLIPIVSVADPEEKVERYSGDTKTNAILMVGQKNKRRIIESKELLQRYAYSVGLTLGNIDIFNYLHQNYHSFKQQAITDGLTGLYNRRFFNEEIEREIARSYRHFLRMSLILLDVDHFKKYNDTNGHQAGDLVLKKVASVLRNETRVCDMECRYGGEEFALILPETNKTQALMIAEKLRRQIEETEFPHQNRQPSGNLTASLGVATFPDDAVNSKDLIDTADAGLYKAKEQGRNGVVAVK